MKTEYQVAIVGAGPAGIAAATALRQAGIEDVVLRNGSSKRAACRDTVGIPPSGCKRFTGRCSAPPMSIRYWRAPGRWKSAPA